MRHEADDHHGADHGAGSGHQVDGLGRQVKEEGKDVPETGSYQHAGGLEPVRGAHHAALVVVGALRLHVGMKRHDHETGEEADAADGR